MGHLLDNGGLLGAKNSFITGIYNPLVYVGGKTYTAPAGSQALFGLSDLTGGIASSPQAGDFISILVVASGTSQKTITNEIGFNQTTTQYSSDSISSVTSCIVHKITTKLQTIVGITVSGSSTEIVSYVVSVWRNVGNASFILNQGINSSIPVFNSITVLGNEALVYTGGSSVQNYNLYTGSGFLDFKTTNGYVGSGYSGLAGTGILGPFSENKQIPSNQFNLSGPDDIGYAWCSNIIKLSTAPSDYTSISGTWSGRAVQVGLS